jgi:hypothetical protein
VLLEITIISLFITICAYFSIYFFFFRDKNAKQYVYYNEKLDRLYIQNFGKDELMFLFIVVNEKRYPLTYIGEL